MSRRYVIIVVVVVEERSPRLFNRCSIPERGNKQDGVIYPKETTIGGYVIFFRRKDRSVSLRSTTPLRGQILPEDRGIGSNSRIVSLNINQLSDVINFIPRYKLPRTGNYFLVSRYNL